MCKRVALLACTPARLPACAAALLNNTSFTCQNFKAQHTLRKGAAATGRGVALGGEGKQRCSANNGDKVRAGGSRWLNDSSQCLPLMADVVRDHPSVYPSLGLSGPYVFCLYVRVGVYVSLRVWNRNNLRQSRFFYVKRDLHSCACPLWWLH